MRRSRVGIIAACAVAAGALAGPATSPAAVTIGSDLAPEPTNGVGCSPTSVPCTVANTTLPVQQTTSPINGVVVRWRIRVALTDLAGNPARLRVIRPAAGTFTGVNTSATRTIGPVSSPTTFEFPTQQAIASGDMIALDVEAGTSTLVAGTDPQVGATFVRWQPPLADGETRVPESTFPDNVEILLNADVEPDADCDGFGDETQDPAIDPTGCNPPPSGDAAAPNTTITKAPKNKTRKKRATFTFSGTDVRVLAGFQCSLDGGPFTSCTSPHKVKVKKGKHTFSVRAVDQAGNVDGTPATDRWKVKKKRKKK